MPPREGPEIPEDIFDFQLLKVSRTLLGVSIFRLCQSVPQVLHTAEQPVHYFDVAGGILAFTQGSGPDGSIWRMPTAGGKAKPLVSSEASPGPIALNSGYIYWNSAALKRIPDNADPITLDYIIDWAEVTQAIQNGSNNVPLVAW